MRNILLRRAGQTAVAVAATASLMLFGGGMAAAHVTVTPSTTAAGSYAVLAFGVPHGCDGSATTEVAIKIPEGVGSVTPTVNPGWTIAKEMVQLDTPLDDGHGGQVTERVDQVVYTALTPLPDDLRDVFELSVRLPDTPGETLVFPAVQTCEQGETAWIETVADGEPSPDYPAPAFVLAASSGDGHGHSTDPAIDDAAASSDTGDETADATAEADDGVSAGTTLGWVALVVAAVAVVMAAMALLRRPDRQ